MHAYHYLWALVMSIHQNQLLSTFSPSPACSCDICRGFCRRPGWWTVSEARDAMEHGLAPRMMLEFPSDFSFGVLSPAFKGNEGFFALQEFADKGCTFLHEGMCELFGSAYRPLECSFCHHERLGEGIRCHKALERDWNTKKGRRTVQRWLKLQGFAPKEISLAV